ncbi:hypothetical protein CK203_029636 [Vitis vinifera]|uniref:Uncharacterized protein n=1 Tax=Vitis vinifera TaxID=29760 RepID=A0A438IIG2_VITVI|nr:hypothetical protein CK203_029636 [Vitis vinifera]
MDGQLPKRFGKIKHCLMQPPILSSPIPKEKLYMYLAVSEWAISAVLFRCPSPKEQKPIYYVSRALADVETRYSKMELTALAFGALPKGSDPIPSPPVPNWGTFGSKPSGWDFLPPTMKPEYEAILSGLDLALALSVSKLRIHSDSQLVQFTEWTIEKIKRADNRHADALAGTQADGREWMYDITEYIRAGTLPGDLKQAHKVRVQAARFTLIGGHLYKRSFTGPYLRCLGHSEAQYVLAELHEGIYGNHSGGRSLAHRAHSQGYYWPIMKKDAAAYVKNVINVKELPGVLWAYRTTPGRPTGNTPFALAYGMDAVIPTEIGLPTIRTDAAKQSDANMELGRNLDWTDEVRESAAIRMANYQQRGISTLQSQSEAKSLQNGTLVLRKFLKILLKWVAGKFQANWEGPYIVSKASNNGAYHLQKLDGTPLLRPWNVSNLKQYYQ